MKQIATALTLLALTANLSACAGKTDNYYADREFGQAQMASWDKMIAFPDAPMAGEIPTGMSGVAAEEIMTLRTKSLGEKTKTLDVFEFGVTR